MSIFWGSLLFPNNPSTNSNLTKTQKVENNEVILIYMMVT